MKFFYHKDDCENSCSSIGNRTCKHDTVDSHENRENDHQRYQKNNLSRHGKKNSLRGFSDGSEEIGSYRLQSVKEGAEQKNPEKFYGKLVI